jgi:hypothetical protein
MDELGDIVNVAQMKLTVKKWMLTARKKTVQKSIVMTDCVCVQYVCRKSNNTTEISSGKF